MLYFHYMNLRTSIVSSIVLVVIAVLLVVGLRYFGITGRQSSDKKSFTGFSESSEKCLVGVYDPERSLANPASEGFTCPESLRFLYNQPGAYTSQLIKGSGLKINLPAGWSVDEKPAGGEGVWLTLAQFSMEGDQYSAQPEKVLVFDEATKAEDFNEFKQEFPTLAAKNIGGFQVLTDNKDVYAFVDDGLYWIFSPATDFVLNSLERVGK